MVAREEMRARDVEHLNMDMVAVRNENRSMHDQIDAQKMAREKDRVSDD